MVASKFHTANWFRFTRALQLSDLSTLHSAGNMAVSRQKWRRKGTTGCGIVLMSWKEAMNAPAGAVSPVSVLASAPRSTAANSVVVLTVAPFLLLFTCAHARHSAPASFSALTASKHYSTWSGTVLLPPLSLPLSLVYICLLVVESRRCLRVLLSPLLVAAYYSP